MKKLLLIFVALLAGCGEQGCDKSKFTCEEKKIQVHHVSEFTTICIDNVLYFTDEKLALAAPISPVYNRISQKVVVCE